jgi:hypothetical protein
MRAPGLIKSIKTRINKDPKYRKKVLLILILLIFAALAVLFLVAKSKFVTDYVEKVTRSEDTETAAVPTAEEDAAAQDSSPPAAAPPPENDSAQTPVPSSGSEPQPYSPPAPAPPASLCSPSPGAAAGATVLGPTTYNSAGTTTVQNVIFDGTHSDDLVRVNTGKVIFENVTFRGSGSGAFGHTLEIKLGGSAEVRNSVFEGDPVEDTIQLEGNGTSLIECNRIGGSPGEDHIDTKPGASVTIRYNTFTSEPAAQSLENQNSSNPVHLVSNSGMHKVFFENLQQGGTIVGNEILDYVWLYDVSNILVEANTIPTMKHGEGSGNRDPVDVFYKNNSISTFQFNGGSCYKSGTNGAALSQCTAGTPPWL